MARFPRSLNQKAYRPALKKRARVIIIESDSEDDAPRPKKRTRKTAVLSDFEDVVVKPKQEEDEDVKITDAPPAPGEKYPFRDQHSLGLFYPEMPSKKRNAKRILCIRSTSEPTNTGASEDITLKPDWNDSDNVINLFIEGKLVVIGMKNKCHLEFKDAAARNTTTLGQIRSQIAKCLSVKDVYSISLESSTLTAKARTFKARGSVCDRANALWNEIGHTDQKTAEEVLQHVRAPWLRVRQAEYIVLSLPGFSLEAYITPSGTAAIRDIRSILANIAKSDLPQAFHLKINDLELAADEETLEDVVRLYNAVNHKAVITCTQEIHECSICAEDVGYLDWPKNNSTICEHEGTTCTPCIQKWITEALDQNLVDRITCPECEVVMEHNDIKQHATEEDFARYERLSLRLALNAMPDFRWCIGPNCDSGQIHDAESGTIFTCNSCKYRSCTTCEREFHDGESCEQYTQRMAAQDNINKASEDTIAALTKECPKCKARIEKNGGCDHMTCRKCRSQFCWLCGADYVDINREGNTAHAADCQYHSGNIPDPHNYHPAAYAAAWQGRAAQAQAPGFGLVGRIFGL